MVAPNFHFQIGQFPCIVVQDAADSGPAEQFFPNVSRAELEPLLDAYGLDSAAIPFSYNCLAVKLPEGWLLMDGGQGTRFGKQPQLVNALAAEHILPEDITHIFLSHGHLDHYGGLMTDNGDFVFPNAHYWMGRAEWDYWTSEARMPELEARNPARAELLRRYLRPIHPRLTQLQDSDSFLPGVQALNAPGHTPHHMLLRLESGGQTLLYIGDAAMHPFHLEHPDWQSSNDADAEQAQATRRIINWMAAETNAIVVACHFPFPGSGRLESTGAGHEWQPLK